MVTTPRTPDDGRDERQRQQRGRDARSERTPDDGHSVRQHLEKEKQNPEFVEHMREARQHHDFIERTRPDDPSENLGQLTRDNVNPDIPSAEPGKGGIVDPNTLGMPQGQEGTPPPEPTVKPEQWPSLGLDHTKDAGDQEQEAKNRQRQAQQGSGGLGEPPIGSINEPPGSQVLPEQPEQPTQQPEQGRGARQQSEQQSGQSERDPLPSEAELHGMTRAELDELAEERDVDISDANNKQDVIDALKKDARKRKRG